ncbi:MAG: Fe-S cluster assembly protein SufD, partial [Rhodothermales bacterium]
MATTELAVQDRLESRFVTAFEMHDGHTLNGTNASLQRHRREAIRTFEELGFPGRKNEAWKYTNIRPALSRDYRIVVAGDAAREDFDIQPFLIPELDAHLIVTVNGRFSDQLSQIGSLPKGVIVTGFAK